MTKQTISQLDLAQRRADVVAAVLLEIAGEYHNACQQDSPSEALAVKQRLRTASHMLWLAGYDTDRQVWEAGSRPGVHGAVVIRDDVGAHFWANLALDLASRHLTDTGYCYPRKGAEWLTPHEQVAALALRLLRA